MDEQPLTTGTDIDGYVIEGLLGSGGFGRVYRARAPDGTAVALKIFRREAGSNPTSALGWQQNEVEALISLSHPGLVDVRGYGVHEGNLYLAMELVEGQSLSAYVNARTRLDPLEAIAITAGVADALAASHARNILHLDLKPEHVFLVDVASSKIKIVDFGLAHLSRGWEETGRGRIAGTPEYMAPECFDGRGIDARADLYALGVILYALLAGRVPFGIKSIPLLQDAKRSSGYVPLEERVSGLPAALVDLVDRLLDADPDNRPSSAAELAEQLRRLYFETLGGDSVELEVEAPRQTPIHDSQFVGRWVELSVLRRAWSEASAGGSAAVLVVGAAGVGKSRLLSEAFEGVARERGFVAYGRCRNVGGVIPYAPLREMMGGLIEQLELLPSTRKAALRARLVENLGDDVAMMVSLVPELGAALEHPRAERHGPFVAGPMSVARGLAAMLESFAASATVTAVLEDLHWADDALLDVMRSVRGDYALDGVLLVASSRSPLMLAPSVEVLELLPLSPQENRALLRGLLGTSDDVLLDALLAAVPLLKVGNPLVAHQVVRHLRMHGCIRTTPGGEVVLQPAELAHYEAPASVGEVLERAVDGLTPQNRAVLEVGALIGRQFSMSDLASMFDPASVGRAILQARSLGLCSTRLDVCSLAHDTIREQLADAIPTSLRSQWHLAIADRLRERGAPAAELAHHLEHAGRTQEAVVTWLAAAQTSDACHDPKGASRHLRHSLRLAATLRATPERDQMLREAAYELVRVAGAIGSTQDALYDLSQAAELLGFSEPGARVDVVVTSSFARIYYLRGDFPRAVELARGALEGVERTGAPERLRVAPMNILGRVLCTTGRFAAAARELTEGCELARKHDDTNELCHSVGLLGVALGFTGAFETARRYVDESAELARRLGDPIRMLAALFYAAMVGEYSYDWRHGVARTAEALQFADAHQIDGLYRHLSMMLAGRHQFHAGHLERARLLLESCVHGAEEQGQGMGTSWAMSFLGDVHFVAGRYQEALQCYQAGLGFGRAGLEDEYGISTCLMGRAHVAAAMGGGRQEIEQDAGEALERLRNVGNRAMVPWIYQRHGDAMLFIGDDAKAHELSELASWSFRALGIEAAVDWWPAPPHRSPESIPSNREYWLMRAKHRVQPSRLREGVERSELVGESSRAAVTESLTELSKAILTSLDDSDLPRPLFQSASR